MKLYLNTVSDLLWEALQKLMNSKKFESFRIVGGTSLSLEIGHRESVDIDLFTDAEYSSLDFSILESELNRLFTYVDPPSAEIVGMGKSYFIGNNENELIKLDLFYTDTYAFPCIQEQGVRFTSIEEIAAMKFEVIANTGRKKDFWDIHEILNTFSLDQILDFYVKRNPFGESKDHIKSKLTDFSKADKDFNPICYKGKEWELIKLDLEKIVKKIN